MSTEVKRRGAAEKIANKACTQFPIVAQEQEKAADRLKKDRRRKKS